MKKFGILLVMIVAMLSFTEVKSQNATLMSLAAGDTVATSTSLDTVSKVISVTAGYSALGIQVKATKVGGTVTAKAYLYSSLDGSAYNLTDSATAFANASGAQSVWFTKITTPYTYYKVQVRPPGSTATSETLAIRVYYVLRRHN